MRIDIPRSEAWISVSEKCRAALSFQDPAVVVQAHMGFPHALHEAAHGLAHLYSHKKTIVAVTPVEPIVDSILIGFSEEGYTVHHLTPDKAADPSGAWLTPLLNDLLLVVYSSDDPVTGRFYDRGPLNEALKEKRVFRISLTHSPRFVPSILGRPAPFDVRIISSADDFAVITAGERFRVTPFMAGYMPWRLESAVPDLTPVPDVERFKKTILDFETNLPAGFKAYFSPSDSRVFDRAVIFHEEIDGSALAETLADVSGRFLTSPGRANPYEAISPCRWNDQRLLDWLLARGEPENIIRGLVVIDPEMIDLGLRQRLAEAAAVLLKMQQG